MAIFTKKPDPISESSRALNRKIADLESEIRRLSAQAEKGTAAPPPTRPVEPRNNNVVRAHQPAAPVVEPVFEDVRHLRAPVLDDSPRPAAHYNELGVRKFDITTIWDRIRRKFHGPTASNPRLVQFLAAGSIKGLRTLRYERRVARTRFLTFFCLLVLALYGLLYFFMRNR